MLVRRSPHDEGFTVIEAIVAMIILSVVLIGLGSLAIGGYSNAQKSQSERSAVEAVNNGINVFSDDLKRSKSPDRDENVVSDKGQLTSALLQATPIKRKNASNVDVKVDVADILFASGQEIWIRADRNFGGGPEADCVRYYLDASSATYRVLRDVIEYVPPVAGDTPGTITHSSRPTGPDTSRGWCDWTKAPYSRTVVVERLN